MLFVFALIAGSAFSQELRVNTYAGYVFDDGIDSYYSSTFYYKGAIRGGFRWGAGIEYQLPNTTRAFELQYLRRDTSVPTVYQNGGIFGGVVQRTEFDLAANWIMLNGTNYFPVSEKVEPFVGAELGMVIFNIENPDNGNSDGGTKFAWGIRGGSNFRLPEKVGIRVQASLLSAVAARTSVPVVSVREFPLTLPSTNLGLTAALSSDFRNRLSHHAKKPQMHSRILSLCGFSLLTDPLQKPSRNKIFFPASKPATILYLGFFENSQKARLDRKDILFNTQ